MKHLRQTVLFILLGFLLTACQAETGQRSFFTSPNSVSGEAVGFK